MIDITDQYVEAMIDTLRDERRSYRDRFAALGWMIEHYRHEPVAKLRRALDGVTFPVFCTDNFEALFSPRVTRLWLDAEPTP